MKDFQDNWNTSYMKNFQDNWNTFYMKQLNNAQDNWNISYMKEAKPSDASMTKLKQLEDDYKTAFLKEFQDNWNVSYMKAQKRLPRQVEHLLHEEFPRQLEYFLHEGSEGLSGQLEYFVHEVIRADAVTLISAPTYRSRLFSFELVLAL